MWHLQLKLHLILITSEKLPQAKPTEVNFGSRLAIHSPVIYSFIYLFMLETKKDLSNMQSSLSAL